MGVRNRRCWQLAKSGGTEEGGTAEHDELLRLMEADFAALAHFQAVGAATESTFPWGPEVREMDPEATLKATTAQAEAAENTTVRALYHLDGAGVLFSTFSTFFFYLFTLFFFFFFGLQLWRTLNQCFRIRFFLFMS